MISSRPRKRGAKKWESRAGQSGQATIEYILILSLVLAGTVAFSRALIGTLDRGILALGGQLEKDLKTGRVDVEIWKN